MTQQFHFNAFKFPTVTINTKHIVQSIDQYKIRNLIIKNNGWIDSVSTLWFDFKCRPILSNRITIWEANIYFVTFVIQVFDAIDLKLAGSILYGNHKQINYEKFQIEIISNHDFKIDEMWNYWIRNHKRFSLVPYLHMYRRIRHINIGNQWFSLNMKMKRIFPILKWIFTRG